MDSALKSVDFSGQGLTVVPTTLFKRRDIAYLNLSSNNIRSLPLDIHLLSMLRRLDLSSNGLRCTNPNDTTTLPREMEQLVLLEELVLAECNLVYIPATVWQLTSLQRLDISRNRLGRLPSEIGNLFNLRHLNAQQTGLKTLPAEIVCCEQLESLLIFGNPIDSLPDTMRELARLRTLSLNTRAFCAVIDDHMETLLQKGQIQSEHIAPVLFDIPNLQSLELENCKINHLPDSIAKGLSHLSIAYNYFAILPLSVCAIVNLHSLDISCNAITSLPPEIKQLQSLHRLMAHHNQLSAFIPQLLEITTLEHLDLCHNSISELPDRISTLKNLSALLLSENQLSKLPETVCEMTALETLDLTGNKLTRLPTQMYQLTNIRTAHTYEGLFRVGLWLHRNPLKTPTPNVWKTKDPAKIWNYLRSFEIRGIDNLQTLKVVTIGTHGSGKSSLLSALTTGRHNDPVRPTAAYDMVSWTTADTVRFFFVDLGTHPVYHSLLPKMLDRRALLLLTADVGAVMRNGFAHEVGPWLERVFFFAPGAAVMLVGTKMDAYLESLEADASEAGEDGAEAESGGGATPNGTATAADSLGEEYQDSCSPDPAADVARSLGELLWREATAFIAAMPVGAEEERPVLCGAFGRVLVTAACSEGLLGVQELGAALETAATNERLFPHNRRYVLPTWRYINTLIKRREAPYLLREEVEEAAQREYGVRGQTITDCLQFLHDTGQVFHFADLPVLDKFVFHRPRRLQRLLSCICRADLDDFLDFTGNRIFRCRGHLTEEQFQAARDMALDFGELSQPIVDCMLFEMQTAGLAQCENIGTLTRVAELFGVGYAVALPEVPQAKIFDQPVLVLPQCNRTEAPPDFLASLGSRPDDAGQWRRSAVAEFQRRVPIGLWEFLLTELHALVDHRIDWRQLVYARAGPTHLLLRRRDPDGGPGASVSAEAWREEEAAPGVDLVAWFEDTLRAVHTVWPCLPIRVTAE